MADYFVRHAPLGEEEARGLFQVRIHRVIFEHCKSISCSDFFLILNVSQSFQHLVSSLSHCHKCWPRTGPVCHRDLKPQNLLLVGDDDQSRVLKLCDFGLGRGDAELREPSAQTTLGHGAVTKGVGTVAYMPPEVATPGGAAYSGCAADIWSAGVVLFAMCLYALPFGNGTGGQQSDTIRRIRNRDFTAPLPEVRPRI